MTEDDETLIATLQLLLGDADNKRLFTLLTNAFGRKVVVLTPNLVNTIQHELAQTAISTKRASDTVSEPPLGRLACIQVKQELDAALNGIRKLENFLGNPTR